MLAGGWRSTHLDGVRLFGVFVMHDAETQGVFGVFVEHQCGALKPRDRTKNQTCT